MQFNLLIDPPEDKLENILSDCSNSETSLFSLNWIIPWKSNFLPHQNWLSPLNIAYVSSETKYTLAFPFAIQKISIFKVASLAGPYGPYRHIFCQNPCNTGSRRTR